MKLASLLLAIGLTGCATTTPLTSHETPPIPLKAPKGCVNFDPPAFVRCTTPFPKDLSGRVTTICGDGLGIWHLWNTSGRELVANGATCALIQVPHSKESDDESEATPKQTPDEGNSETVATPSKSDPQSM